MSMDIEKLLDEPMTVPYAIAFTMCGLAFMMINFVVLFCVDFLDALYSNPYLLRGTTMEFTYSATYTHHGLIMQIIGNLSTLASILSILLILFPIFALVYDKAFRNLTGGDKCQT